MMTNEEIEQANELETIKKLLNDRSDHFIIEFFSIHAGERFSESQILELIRELLKKTFIQEETSQLIVNREMTDEALLMMLKKVLNVENY